MPPSSARSWGRAGAADGVWQVGPVTGHVWERWRRRRPATDLLHLDSAAFGRASTQTLASAAEHARHESEAGGYIAEEAAAPALATLRRDLGGLLGTDADGVAFVEGAMAALASLIAAWPLPPGARVGVAASAWGPNLELLEHHGLHVQVLPCDADGVLDLEALRRLLDADPPAVLLVDHVAAHRGLVQPLAEILVLAGEAGVPVWVDAAQSVGHVQVPPGAGAVFATSRKWLTGPRGVGMLAIAARHRGHLRPLRLQKYPDRQPVLLLESEEAHVAGRVGLGVAVREYLDLGPPEVQARLAEVGRRVREAVGGLPGWAVDRPGAPAGATTSLRPLTGQDVVHTRERLLHEHRVLTSACLRWRAPHDGGVATLRLSPHVDLTDEDLERMLRALRAVTTR